MVLRVANGAGFLGDWLDAPRRTVEGAEVDVLTLEYLAELTLSILARARQQDPEAGYARDLVDVVRSLLPALERQPQLRLMTNGGGMNPRGAVREVARELLSAGLGDMPLGVVTGDDLLARLPELQAAGCRFEHFDTGQPLAELGSPVVSANAYLGARPLAEALGAGAQHVIAGRVADASLTLAPAMQRFGWAWDDWPRVAQATTAGHLIECGAQVTGGYSVDWARLPGGGLSLAEVGYPIAEIDEQGGVTIAKPPGSGGRVDRLAVIEQLVYEIGDPRHYLTPDVDLDLTGVEVDDAGPDRIAVRGAAGRPPPETLKVSLAYHNGYTAAAQLLVHGDDCLEKARACAAIVWRRLAAAGCACEGQLAELLGAGDGVPRSLQGAPHDDWRPREVVLRLAARDRRRECVERFTKEVAPLATSGPAGLAGYAVGRSSVRPVLAYWPTRVPRALVEPQVEVRTAREWSGG